MAVGGWDDMLYVRRAERTAGGLYDVGFETFKSVKDPGAKPAR